VEGHSGSKDIPKMYLSFAIGFFTLQEFARFFFWSLGDNYLLVDSFRDSSYSLEGSDPIAMPFVEVGLSIGRDLRSLSGIEDAWSVDRSAFDLLIANKVALL